MNEKYSILYTNWHFKTKQNNTTNNVTYTHGNDDDDDDDDNNDAILPCRYQKKTISIKKTFFFLWRKKSWQIRLSQSKSETKFHFDDLKSIDENTHF